MKGKDWLTFDLIKSKNKKYQVKENCMKLINALATIQYDRNWGIWAEFDGRPEPESEARFGQRLFENGGVLDDKKFVCDGETAGDFLSEWWDDDGELINGWFEEFMDSLDLG